MRHSHLLAAAAAAALLAARPAGAQTLRGSPSSVERAYDTAVSRGLTFHRSAATVQRAVKEKTFVRLTGAGYRLNRVALPYVLPATRVVLEELAAAYWRACGERLVVTSAVRPVGFRLTNGNARSVHPTGLAFDLRSPHGRCRTWIRRRLLAMEREGRVDATEERFPAHFHVVVYRSRVPSD
jgi:hypothetical protein